MEKPSMTTTSNNRPVAVIAGAGPGNGQALAQRFADAGYAVALLARDRAKVEALAANIANARGYACDVGDAASVATTFAAIRADLGEVESLLYNAGAGVFADVETITPEQFEAAWRVNALGSLLCSKQVFPAMIAQGHGSIVFIGATASRRGGIHTAAFAPAKAAQRSLAEIHGARALAKGGSRRPRHHRRHSRPSHHTPANARQASGIICISDRARGDGSRPDHPGSPRLEF